MGASGRECAELLSPSPPSPSRTDLAGALHLLPAWGAPRRALPPDFGWHAFLLAPLPGELVVQFPPPPHCVHTQKHHPTPHPVAAGFDLRGLVYKLLPFRKSVLCVSSSRNP